MISSWSSLFCRLCCLLLILHFVVDCQEASKVEDYCWQFPCPLWLHLLHLKSMTRARRATAAPLLIALQLFVCSVLSFTSNQGMLCKLARFGRFNSSRLRCCFIVVKIAKHIWKSLRFSTARRARWQTVFTALLVSWIQVWRYDISESTCRITNVCFSYSFWSWTRSSE